MKIDKEDLKQIANDYDEDIKKLKELAIQTKANIDEDIKEDDNYSKNKDMIELDYINRSIKKLQEKKSKIYENDYFFKKLKDFANDNCNRYDDFEIDSEVNEIVINSKFNGNWLIDKLIDENKLRYIDIDKVKLQISHISYDLKELLNKKNNASQKELLSDALIWLDSIEKMILE